MYKEASPGFILKIFTLDSGLSRGPKKPIRGSIVSWGSKSVCVSVSSEAFAILKAVIIIESPLYVYGQGFPIGNVHGSL